jgi:linoleoyl-CoA desaturase
VALIAPIRTAPLKFPPHTSLRDRLNQAVDAYFERGELSRHGGARMWVKSAVMIAWTVMSYVVLVFMVHTWWQALLAAISLGLAVAGIGFNVMHDGGHGSYSASRLLNRLSARTLDLIGGSSYMWNYKHNILHHHFTNVDGVDDDLEAEPFLRFAPGQRRYWFHRFQYLYVWLLYGFLPPKWQWYDDFKDLITARKGNHAVPRPRGTALAWLFVGKALFFGWALILPLVLHPVLNVLAVYSVVALVTGVTMGVVFQLAHCVEEAEITPLPEGDIRLPRSWAEHQLATTADFAPGTPILTSYLGGLNYQIEHHLFPRISHIHYPALAAIVRDVCSESGVRHIRHPSLWSAVTSHIRFLKRMGRPDAAQA